MSDEQLFRQFMLACFAPFARRAIEELGNILADLMQGAAAAGASPDAINFLDIDNLLDPLQVCGQRAAVGLARSLASCRSGRRLAFRPRLTKRGLDILKAQLQLLGVELLGSRTEPMPHESIDDRLQPLYLSVGLALGGHELGELPGLLKGERAQRFDVLGKIRFHEHGGIESAVKSPVNRQFAG